jgi:hypothetical protein
MIDSTVGVSQLVSEGDDRPGIGDVVRHLLLVLQGNSQRLTHYLELTLDSRSQQGIGHVVVERLPVVNSISRSQAAPMSASHARGSRGINKLSRFLNSPTQVRVAYRAYLNQVDLTLKKLLHSRQKTQVRVCAVGVRHIVKVDEEVDVARLLVEVTASR